MDGINGTSGPFAGAQIIAPKITFGEPQLRAILGQVRNAVSANAGQVPVSDPAGLLAIGVLLDKLDQISDRLAKLEARVVPARGDWATAP